MSARDPWAHLHPGGSAHSVDGPLGCHAVILSAPGEAAAPADPAAARRSALARCRAGSATDANRALLAAPSADGRTMLGPAECQRCAQHPRRRLTYRWEWPAGSGPDAGDAVELRGCEECADET